jgi:hypothetical protein
MPVPWLQIVQLVPSIVEVSRELLKHTRQPPPGAGFAPPDSPAATEQLLLRVAALEDNERRQAELINKMAEQLAGLTKAVTVLHARVIWLAVASGVSLVIALTAVIWLATGGSGT